MTRPGLLTRLLVVVLLVAACGGGEGANPDGTSPSGGNVTPTTAASTTPDGSASDFPATGIPEGFPSDEIPLIDGEYLVGGKEGGSEWVVRVKVDGDPQQAKEEAATLLLDAGYEELLAGFQYRSDSWTVVLQAGEDRGTALVSYSIVRR